jgi:4-amino-4-deoxy-L-arabinose transferase-like glycosyltransferase
VAPGVVWLTASSLLAPPGYVDESFWDNLILRFFSGTAHARPVWFYVEALPRGFLPWTLLWPLAWWRHRALQREADRAPARAWRFLLSSIGAAFVFFSLSAGKRGLYLLPVYPLIAVACGDALAAWSAAAGAPSRRLRPSLFAGIALLVAVGLGSLVCGRAAPIVVPASFGWLLAGGGAVAWLVERTLWWRGAERAALVAGAASGLVGAALAFQTGLQPALNARNSQRPVAEIALRATPPGATIGVYRNETLAAAVGYYARRPVRALREPAELACFLAAGGHTLVVEDVQLGALTEQTPLREVGRGRTRQRQLHVLVRGR